MSDRIRKTLTAATVILAAALPFAAVAEAMEWPVVKEAKPAAKLSINKAAPATQPAKEKVAAPKPAPPPITLKISINLTSQRMTVTENGKTRYTWRISSGRRSYPTPNGTYKPYRMHKMWRSRKYDNAPMPNSIFFHKGFAIHATYATRALGRPASHGCIRLSPSNAKTLYRMVSRHGKASTKVAIHGQPRFGRYQVAKKRKSRRRAVPPRGYAYRYARPRRQVLHRQRYRRSPYASANRFRYPGDY
jgi:lipoprotein-anchoring transpeptidase ErfK/SrfK